MREESIARRYASALLAEAERTNTVVATASSLKTVARTIAENETLHGVLNQPVVTSDQKKALLKTAFGASMEAPIPSFLNLLIDKRRIDIVGDIAEAFDSMVNIQQNIERAVAQTAVALTAAEKLALTRSLEKRTGKTIQLETEVDPSVIGGVFVRIGDMVYDGTVRGNLERLRDQLLTRR